MAKVMIHRCTFYGVIAVLVWFIPLLVSVGISAQQQSYIPKDGFVPDEKTAVRIAEAVLIPIYGEDKITEEQPLSAKLNDRGDIWTVLGRLPVQYNKGGVAMVKIAKADGRIVQVTHGK